ncbi:MAG TPA: chemotaxis protein CheB [Pirellulales bacterium]|nr:chemotaxis protein CheB [Pirellulales bacterium]
MPTSRDILVIGGSAGAVEPLRSLIRSLPADFDVAVFAVLHVPPDYESLLPEVLATPRGLPVEFAQQGQRIEPGRVSIAPPDHHLMLRADRMEVTHGPRENHSRPAIDPLFRTAARAFGSRVVAVLLSGMLGDGTAGFLAVRNAGGYTIIQDPGEAAFSEMPQKALRIAGADEILPSDKIPARLIQLAQQRPGGAHMDTNDPIDEMPEVVNHDKNDQVDGKRIGQPSLYTCPECGGVLWQVDGGPPLRFRCHVGHSYYGETLWTEQAEGLEAGLWISVRSFMEKATLARQLAAQNRRGGKEKVARKFEEEAEAVEGYANLIRERLLGAGPSP